MMKMLRVLLIGLLSVFTLSACPGGSGDICSFGEDCTGGGGSGGGGGAAASKIVIVGNTQLPSNANGTSVAGNTLTAIVTDSNGVVISGATVSFQTSCILPDCTGSNPGGALAPASTTTDASGQINAVLTTGGDAKLRTIKVTATSGSASGTINVQVINPPSSGGGGAVVDSVSLLTSSPQLLSSADTVAEGVTLTAVVKDANNVLLTGVEVAFGTTSGGGALQVTRATTDATGTAEAILTTGGDPTNRPISVSATAAGPVTGTLDVPVVGTSIVINGPSSLGSSSTGAYTVTLKDAAGIGIAGRTLTATSSAGNTLATAPFVTNATGQVTINLTATSATTPDTLTVTGLGTSATKSIAVATRLLQVLDPSPSAATAEVAIGSTRQIAVKLSNAGTPIDGVTINFTTTRGTITASAVTGACDFDGGGLDPGVACATFSPAPTNNAGLATITATDTVGGLTTSAVVEVISVTPTAIDVQAAPAHIAPNTTSTIKAVVRDSIGNFVKNQTVNFAVIAGPGSVSPASGITNSDGVVTVTYTATGATTSTNGVTVRGTVAAISDDALLTIGGIALRISLGTGNEIQEPNTTQYKMPWSVIVTDADGNPPPVQTTFTLSVESIAFAKGYYDDVLLPANKWEAHYTHTCANEDTDRDGIRDDPGGPADEDINGNGILDPGNVATVPSTIALTNGNGLFDITYAQQFGNWVAVTLRAIASVDGTESLEERTFVLPITSDDADTGNAPPGGAFSPWGAGGSAPAGVVVPASTGCDDLN